MTINNFPVILTVLATVIGLLVKVRRDAREGGTLGRLRSDAEVLKLIPVESDAHTKLLEHMATTVESLVRQRTTLSRDSMGVAVSIFLSVIAAFLLFFGYRAEGGLRVLLFALSSPFVLFGIVGFSVSVPKRERDEKGNTRKTEG